MLNLFRNRYPYTDFHELNADWLIKTVIELAKKVDEFVLLNTLKYADPIQWSIDRQYGKNTVVIDPSTNIAYISTNEVPLGVHITNTDYWTPIIDLSDMFDVLNNCLTLHVESIGTTNATFNSEVGDWILLNGKLYAAIVPITIGEVYAPDSNIKQITVEEIVDTTYYPNDKKLEIHSKISDYSQIVTQGDYHIYNPRRSAIEIKKVD